MQSRIVFSPPDLPGYDFMNELMAKLASMVSSRSGTAAPEDAQEGEIWVKTETYLDEDDNELQRMTLMIRRNGADVDILSEFKSENLLQRVIDATAEKLAGSLVLRNDVGAAALDVIGNADTATKFKTAMEIKLTGAVTGAVNISGDAGVSMATTAANSVIVPAGVIVAYYHTAAPVGWFLCDGTLLDAGQQTANPNLTILLKLWNNDAALLPDLRGYFIRGYDNRTVKDGGNDPNKGVTRGFASKQNDAMRRISGQAPSCDDSSRYQDNALFTVSDWGVAKDLDNNSGWYQSRVWFDSAGAYLWEYVNGRLVQNQTKRLSLYTDVENRPKNMALNYIIKGG